MPDPLEDPTEPLHVEELELESDEVGDIGLKKLIRFISYNQLPFAELRALLYDTGRMCHAQYTGPASVNVSERNHYRM